jgi:hypothetical protein
MSSERETHLHQSEGVWIPPDLRAFDRQVVFRTPWVTIQHYGSGELDGHYGAIRPSHFGGPEKMRNSRNPELVPDRMTIKPASEEATMFVVDRGEDGQGVRR